MSDSKQTQGIGKLIVTVCLMFGFGYALVPLYDVFCDLTGLRFTDDQAATVPLNIEEDLDRWVTVEFDVSLNQSMPWKVAPKVRRMKVNPGVMYVTSYVAENVTGHDMTGQAVPSVAPYVANRHLIKTECFCFENQMIEAGEQVDMPLAFMIDPKLPEDVNMVTLSYTFFDITQTAQAETKDSVKL